MINEQERKDLINQETVKRIADLARLALDETEAAGYEKDLGDLLMHFQTIKQIDTSHVRPAYHPRHYDNHLRQDEATESAAPETWLSLARQTKDGFYKVPKVVD